jgi:arginyl-tRNA synthetase
MPEMPLAIDMVNKLKTAIADAINKAARNGELKLDTAQPGTQHLDFNIETPADRTHGDFSSNAAMANAKTIKLPPRKIAEIIVNNFDQTGLDIEKIEIAGPGFINFYLSSGFYGKAMSEIVQQGDNYGQSDYGKNQKVMVEFVSANPTGPMHMGNARGGAIGDCLAAVMKTAGYDSYKEFYVNDAGNQIEKFAQSLNARYLQIFKGERVQFPEDGYQGADITERAEEFAAENGDSFVNAEEAERKAALVEFALPKNISKMQSDLQKYRIEYDRWFFESELHNSGKVEQVINLLKAAGLTYEKDGALWYKNAEVVANKLRQEGKSEKDIEKLELKDDVLVRQNGNPTYFAADIAYHKDKFDRGFKTLINVWGADHHGHVMRMKCAMDAIGCNGDDLTVILMQLVKLVQNGQQVRMSKRTGKAVQLADLLEEVPVDSTRFLFNTAQANVPMDFDLDLAVKQDSQNPVYYVQYAHARICSIIRSMAEEGITQSSATQEDFALLQTAQERDLIFHLAQYPGEIIYSAKEKDPTKITRYVTETAALFHKFYNSCRVKGEEQHLAAARLALCVCTKTVIANVLRMFNITCPEKM